MEEDFVKNAVPVDTITIGKASTCSHREKKDKERVKGRLPLPLCYVIRLII